MLPIMMKSTGIEIITHKQRAKTFSCVHIPQFERPVLRSRYDKVSCRTDGTPIHPIRVPAQAEPLFPGTGIPYLERAIIRGGYDSVSPRTECTSAYRSRMSAQCALFLA